MNEIVIGSVIFGAVGLLHLGLGIPLLLKRVPPNRLYGFRTRVTLADEALWYRVNTVLGRRQVALGFVTLALAWGLPLVPGISREAYVLTCVSWLIVSVIGLCVGTQLTARRLVRNS